MEISFILVNPSVPENIGASARALKTMGFNSLALIDPCDDPEGRAHWLAHGSDEILNNAKVYNSLEDAITGFDLVIATTARKRWLQKDTIPSNKLYHYLQSKKTTSIKVALVFGREESGLTNSEMKLCDIATTVSLSSGFPSLNLAQAVMIYAYEVSEINRENDYQPVSNGNKDSLRILKKRITELLDITEISGNSVLSGRILERISHAGDKDLNLLHTVTKAVLEKLGNKKNNSR